MQILSFGPVRTGSRVWQARGGSFVLTVVCKTTYWLKPGEAQVLVEQEAINETDDHWDDDPNRSVRAPSDLMPTKPRPEVTLVGYAYAPNKQPVRSLVARLVVGDVDKSIEVFGDRTFLSDGTLQEGPRFTRMRLTWERAAGGPGTNNPVGIRADNRDAYGRRALPNLQPIGTYVASIDDYVPPIGFGPIAESWPSRADLVGRVPPPAGTGLEGPSAAYFNAAPSDQLLGMLRENERIVLENLHPEHQRLVTNLPGLRPAIFVDRGRGAPHRASACADALWIDTDRSVATLTWRALIPLAAQDEPGRVLVGMEASGHELSFAELAQSIASGKVTDEDDETGDDSPIATITGAYSVGGPALPFSARQQQGEIVRAPAAALPFRPSSSASPAGAARPVVPSIQTPPQPPVRRPPSTSAMPAPSVGITLPGTVISSALGVPAPPPVPPAPVTAPPPVPPAPVAPRPSVSPSRPPPPVPPAPVLANMPASLGTPRGPQGAENARSSASPWASGNATAQRETLGTQAAAAAAVAAEPAKESAADGGALGASNEAAGIRPWSAPRRELRAVVSGDDESEKPAISRELLQLVWFERSFVPRIRRVAAWKKLLAELEQRGPDKGIDDVLAGKEAWEIEDRREIFEILARGERTDERGLLHAMDDAIREDGKYATPIVTLGGDIEVQFDELEVLRALSTAAAPLVGPTDEGLKAALEAADKFLGRAGLSWAPVVPEGLSNRIRESFAREKKSLPPDALDVQAERALLGGRHYQKREIFGGTYLRLLLRLSSEGQPLVAYAPEDAAKKLPIFRKFRARIIGELHPSQDQYELRHESIRVLALGTVTYPDRGTAGAKG
ncbi:DUF2169 family type VI secretion system accessory protein [Polyangium aurulentum]|uniref:DUF2169 family type VI secretion system accessory protein n=1 Tax=Polyangium aurulentum TaxID=2567896 RepID=UPI00146A22C2|nr:DUF2169 domain-containing protein [Polyangium aurulentum]UQA58629.1 DUF2169 domain-containing protein [Polyangium aurulentum]